MRDQARVFISYAHRDGADLAERLRLDLEDRQYIVWLDKLRLQGGSNWSREIELALDSSDVVLALLTEGSFESEVCRCEQLRALRHGKCLIPLQAQAAADRPLYLEATQYLEFASRPYEIHSLIQAIDNRAGACLIPEYRTTRYDTVPPLPLNFVARASELDHLRQLLLSDRERQNIALVALRGMGGIGKTVLAQALCNDEAVQAAFPDGIVWLRIGENADDAHLVGQMREAARALGHSIGGFDTLPASSHLLRTLLKEKAALLILDDVWRAEHIYPFQPRNARCCRLFFTTRTGEIAAATGAAQFKLGVLTGGQARRVLAEYAHLAEAELPTAAHGILHKCEGLPLALAVIGALLRDEPPRRWDDVRASLSNADLSEIAIHFPGYAHPSLLAAMHVSVSDLPEEDRNYYLALAVLPEAKAIPEAALETVWGVEGKSVRRIVSFLVKRSLADRDADDRLTLHDLQLSYLKMRAPESAALHEQLVNRYRRRCGWHTGRNDGYFFNRLPYHLKAAGRLQELQELLLDFNWLQKKLEQTNVTSLLADYELLKDTEYTSNIPETLLVKDALRLMAHVAGQDPPQLRSQLMGRLMEQKEPAIRGLCQQTAMDVTNPWLRPLNARLVRPGGMLVRTLFAHSEGVNAVDARLSDDGRPIAISGSWDRSVIVWDLQYGDILHKLPAHSEGVMRVAIARVGPLGLSSSYDGEMILWDLEAGRRVRSFPGPPEGGYQTLSILSDGNHAVTVAGDGTVTLWDLTKGEAIRHVPNRREDFSAACVGTAAEMVLLAFSDGTLLVRRFEEETVDQVIAGPQDLVSVAVTPDGTRAVSVALGPEPKLVLFDVVGRRVLYERPYPFRYGSRAVHVAVSPDAKRAVAVSYDGLLTTWDLATGREDRRLRGETRWVTALAMLPNGRLALTASGDRSLTIWDLEGLEHSSKDHRDEVSAVTVLNDGRAMSLCEADDDGATVLTWDLATGQKIAEEPISATNRLLLRYPAALLPDGHRVLLGDGQDVVLTELRTQQRLVSLSAHTDNVKEVTVTPDGRRAVSVTNNGEIIIWDLESGRVLMKASFPNGGNGVTALVPGTDQLLLGDYRLLRLWDPGTGVVRLSLDAHADFVESVAVTPDGRFAVSAGQDRLLVLWDLRVGEAIAKYTGDNPFTACAVSADGQRVVTADAAGRVHLLQLNGYSGSPSPVLHASTPA